MNKQSKFLILTIKNVFQLWVYSRLFFSIIFSFNNYFLLCFLFLYQWKIKDFLTILFKKYLKKSMQEYMTSKGRVKKVPFKALLSVLGAPSCIGVTEETVGTVVHEEQLIHSNWQVLVESSTELSEHHNSLELKKSSINQKNQIDQLWLICKILRDWPTNCIYRYKIVGINSLRHYWQHVCLIYIINIV